MGYCTVDDVKGEFKTLTLAADSKDGITENEITNFIAQATAQIDSQISNCWSLPIVETTENETLLLNLKTACVWLVADRLIPILQVKSRTANIEQTGQDITYYAKAKSILNMLCPSKETGIVTSNKKSSSNDVAYSENEEPYFQRSTCQW